MEATIGYTAPVMIDFDFDGDGRKDLVMGEFDKGRARIYLYIGTDKSPQCKDFTYLQAGKRDASVTPACCIGFDPSFMDLMGMPLWMLLQYNIWISILIFMRGQARQRFRE